MSNIVCPVTWWWWWCRRWYVIKCVYITSFYNVFYLQGSWKYPFKPHNTMDKPFYINKDTTVNVPMMYLEENFKYGESQKLNAQVRFRWKLTGLRQLEHNLHIYSKTCLLYSRSSYKKKSHSRGIYTDILLFFSRVAADVYCFFFIKRVYNASWLSCRRYHRRYT